MKLKYKQESKMIEIQNYTIGLLSKIKKMTAKTEINIIIIKMFKINQNLLEFDVMPQGNITLFLQLNVFYLI